MMKKACFLFLLFFALTAGVATSALAKPSPESKNLYLFSKSFVSFDLTAGVEETVGACEKADGEWVWDPPREHSYRFEAACVFDKQKVAEDGRLHVPEYVSFGINNEIEIAVFYWEFNTWAQRQHVKGYFRSYMREIFLLGIKKVGKDKYELKNLNYHVKLETKDVGDIYTAGKGRFSLVLVFTKNYGY
jgi:hypothetical protein